MWTHIITCIVNYADEICKSGVSHVIQIDKKGLNSSILLEHSKSSPSFIGNCSIQIQIKNDVEIFGRKYGLLVTSQKFENNNPNENFIEFVNEKKESIAKWLNNSDLHEFGILEKDLKLNLTTTEKGGLAFQIAITVYETTYPVFEACSFTQIHCRNENENFCISDSLNCDGIRNCIQNEDESGCQSTSTTTPTESTTTIEPTTSKTTTSTEPTTSKPTTTTEKITTTQPTTSTTTTTESTTTTKTTTTTDSTSTTTTTAHTTSATSTPHVTTNIPTTTESPKYESHETATIIISVVAAVLLVKFQVHHFAIEVINVINSDGSY
ncbi:hypothetical protein B4U80_14266 [Leptotrombidium deliense]|uniref:Uncharacterized protein n=1 Tax=Leptotrombidium deliense TaxID=299467 RepID=A0A443RYP5_9ACAR|nr:hypothetical protein B4U80_14266 [Leptotrombidium deliense]